MKINTIYHSREARRKECKGDKPLRVYSKAPEHHPMLLEREYVRALNAVKIERMLAKPFVRALTHHKEGINRISKDSNSNLFASTSYDNTAIVWDLQSGNILMEKQLNSPINGVAIASFDERIGLFTSQNKLVLFNHSNDIVEYPVSSTISSMDFSSNQLFVGHTDGISIFDIERTTPRISYQKDDITAVKYNQSLKHVMAGLDKLSINLYDNRSNREFLQIQHPGMNSLAFNSQEGHLFVCGNEDGNSYLFDIRNSSKHIEMYRGHTNAVTAVAFNPNGKEVATGGFDRTVRIFRTGDRKPRDCYYNDRMQLVQGVEYSNDGNFIISGSDDGALRIWKAQASGKIQSTRAEKDAQVYRDALKDKFEGVGEIARIRRHRFFNKDIKEEMRVKHEMYEGKKRRAAKKEKEWEFAEAIKASDEEDE